MRVLPYSFASRFNVIFLEPETLFVVEGVAWEVIEEARRALKRPLNLSQVSLSKFESLLTAVYQKATSEVNQIIEHVSTGKELSLLVEELPENQDLLDLDEDAPIIKLINAILSEAIKEGASDIHLETFEATLLVRFRIDGVLKDILSPNRKLAPLLVSRVKVMAKLDIAEHRVPQDGRISLRVGSRGVDVRVSTMPSAHGERVVLRILDKNLTQLDLQSLGMTEHIYRSFRQLLRKPHGILLVTGPTGSGKSTTLYAGLQELDYGQKNILTVEDPIEFNLEGIGQTQVNPKVDMTFSCGLRAILRQDPDVIMVGEIRDLGTAKVVGQASLTGHLVMSTLHSNTAVGAITRLRNMGMESFLISSSLVGVLAQRLVRVLCADCRQPYMANDLQKAYLENRKSGSLVLYAKKGCKACNFRGYRGRTGVHELLVLDEEVRRLIHKNASEQQIEQYVRQSRPSIRRDGITKVENGITSIEEVMRITEDS